MTLVFTGKLIKFGNFTCLPKHHVQELIQKPYLWNSYSSSIVKAIKDRTFIRSIRGTRYVLPSNDFLKKTTYKKESNKEIEKRNRAIL